MDMEHIYFSKVLGIVNHKSPTKSELERVKAALARSEAARDFEIELYWKRTTYFWGAQVALFAGSSILLVNFSSSFGQTMLINSLMAYGLFIINTLSIAITWLWYLLVMGSKFWQEVWERHIEFLEDYVYGQLHKSYWTTSHFSNSPSQLPFSVTKINRALVISIGLFWFQGTVVSTYFLIESLTSGLHGQLAIYLVLVASVLAGTFYLISTFLTRHLRMSGLGTEIFRCSEQGNVLFMRTTLSRR